MTTVELDHVSYAYGGATPAVRDVSLRIGAGEVVAMLGPNGAGKSTTLLMLLGMLPPRTGTVRLFGGPVAAAVAAGRVGAMPQAGGVPPRSSVGDLLEFLHAVYPQPMPVAEALALADLGGLAGRTVERLSGGQQQRLRFAMAVIGRPDLLVLDEPTAALDVQARRECWAAIRRYAAQGRTVLFSTHHLDEADGNADRIVVLDRGTVIACGTAADVKRRVGVRTVTVTAGAPAGYADLPGVVAVADRGGRVALTTTDSDATVLALAAAGLVRDLEVAGAGLEEAFLSLTATAPRTEGV
ncbi:ABC transporter ATP-binding protein [Dactylosporangium aurantiacum]|uniref:ABC transporter ATP-binding protein n=1 Tax=Dactylosporangium aurantiacum TaxID=35754 RepID=A0A9Q9II28_9ACTN|nr:ABC transporter ATP-binding protein [Dactylosporangium aurantiacum]MDG6102731.1 ABC transporter ATP-binding protein [Dactylosporangium aurantiacum]UWZ53025.1 ABC transporter ATP-binding protein [Dactylosporangium aurantiacum]